MDDINELAKIIYDVRKKIKNSLAGENTPSLTQNDWTYNAVLSAFADQLFAAKQTGFVTSDMNDNEKLFLAATYHIVPSCASRIIQLAKQEMSYIPKDRIKFYYSVFLRLQDTEILERANDITAIIRKKGDFIT